MNVVYGILYMCAHFLRIFYQGQTSFVLGFRIFIVLLFWNAGKFEPATSTFCIHSIYLCQFGKDHRNQHPTFSLNTINVIKKNQFECVAYARLHWDHGGLPMATILNSNWQLKFPIYIIKIRFLSMNSDDLIPGII